jgi:hypothetical protein
VVYVGGESLTGVRGRQCGSTPLHVASKYCQHSAIEWITDRIPYQVQKKTNDGVCVCVCCESLMGVGGQMRHLLIGLAATSLLMHPSLPNAFPASCASRPLWSTRGGQTIST